MNTMKKLLLFFALVTYVNGACAQNSGKASIVIKTAIYCDHCMQCGSCAANIKSKVMKANKGVRSIIIDPKSNTISVSYRSDKTTPDQIRAAINEAGFDADGKKATAEAVSALDDCCKKQ